MNDDVREAFLGHDECVRAHDFAMMRHDLTEANRLIMQAMRWFDEAIRRQLGDPPRDRF